MRREDDHGDGGIERAELRQQIERVAVIQAVVQDGDVGAPRTEGFVSLRTGFGFLNLETVGFQEVANGKTDRGFVVEKENPVDAHAPRRIVTTAPPLGPLAMPIVPACDSTILRTI